MDIKFLQGHISPKQIKNIKFFKRGGMGEIYIGDDIELKQKVAIKLIHISEIEEENLLVSEAKISIDLKHKNIANTYYWNTFEKSGVKSFYILMDFYEKGCLRDLINKNIQLDLNKCLEFMLNISEGLEFAHKKIIHRDLKPENILIGDDNNLKLCDFGLAKYINTKTRTKTFKGFGTLPYMSPECWKNESNSISMDMYSLGIIYFEILTLRQPFNGSSEIYFKDAHLFQPLPNLKSLRDDLPVRLIELISKMTNKRKEDRYSSISEVKNILNEIIKKIDNNEPENSLINKAHNVITELKQKELVQKKKVEQEKTERKFLEFSIDNLLNKFISNIEEINSNIEEAKISYNKTGSDLTIYFNNRILKFHFFWGLKLEEYYKNRIESNRKFQTQNYGMYFQKIEPSHLEKDNIALIGKVEINLNKGQNWGYNLLLKRENPNDQYGIWWLVWFDDSPLVNKYHLQNHYPIDIPDFLQEYEFGRGHVMHIRQMGLKNFEDKDVENILSKLFE